MQTVNTLKSLGADKFRILITRVPPKLQRDGEKAREMLTSAGLPVFKGSVRDAVAFQKAALAGVPVNKESFRPTSQILHGEIIKASVRR